MHKIFGHMPIRLICFFALCCLCGASIGDDDTPPAKPITPDSIPNKIKAMENSDGTLKPKSSASNSSSTNKSSSKTTTPPAPPKEELSQDELVERIAKKMAELHKENERIRLQAQARRASAAANPPSAPHAATQSSDSMKPHDIHWSYEGEGGPARWGKIDPANVKCDTGERQSPIDIRDGIRVDLEPVTFDYKPVRFNVVDTGHTIQVNLGAGNSITILGRRYDLVQFHFHRPSEEKVNGVGYDMVVHLEHKDMDGKLVELAILVEPGKPNSVVQTIWNNMPLEKNDTVQPPGTIDLNQILPASRQYYTYMGSLTTPPCTEGVLWIVFKQPIQLSQDQISIFSRMYPLNARPIQNSAGRLIKESE
jgi:carbonic anhydrase